MSDKPGNQGEGNREAAERYNRETREFVESGKVDEAAERAKKGDEKAMERAEEKGKERAKEFDPNVDRDYSEGTK
ncbi:MAG: hypothetical protein R3298_02620 [Gammaproteobacteria bacterium]|nr:hypothetical protein [Gammaproteobacteria bacterium]